MTAPSQRLACRQPVCKSDYNNRPVPWCGDGGWQIYGTTVEPHLATHLCPEHGASELRSCRLSRVPTLRQTWDYAELSLARARPGAAHPDTDRSVALLAERQRQAALTPLSLNVVLSEAALRLQPDDPSAMHTQVRHLDRR